MPKRVPTPTPESTAAFSNPLLCRQYRPRTIRPFLAALLALALLPSARAADPAVVQTPPGAVPPSAYNTLAVVASPPLRRSGVADLVAAEVGRLPGVRLVERD